MRPEPQYPPRADSVAASVFVAVEVVAPEPAAAAAAASACAVAVAAVARAAGQSAVVLAPTLAGDHDHVTSATRHYSIPPQSQLHTHPRTSHQHAVRHQ